MGASHQDNQDAHNAYNAQDFELRQITEPGRDVLGLEGIVAESPVQTHASLRIIMQRNLCLRWHFRDPKQNTLTGYEDSSSYPALMRFRRSKHSSQYP